MAVTGTASRREKLIRQFKDTNDYQFLVVNYETLRSDKLRNLVKQCRFEVIALDEAQKIKNGVTDKMLNIEPSNTAAACLDLDDIPYRFLATATPVTGKAQEIFSLYSFMNPHILGQWEYFREEFTTYHPRYGITGTQNLGELFFKISPYFIRRTKEMPEIQQQLPSVQHDYVFLEATEAQVKVESIILDKMTDLKEQSRGISGAKVINGQLMNPEQQSEYIDGMIQGLYAFLIENCDYPNLLRHAEASNMSHEIINQASVNDKQGMKSPKIDYLDDLVKQMLYDEPTGKIVLFTEYERMARILYERFQDIAVMYTGKISDNQKDYVVERFRNDPGTKIFIGTRAASTGKVYALIA